MKAGPEWRGTQCELTLRDGRRAIAHCAPTADGVFALALGDVGQPQISRQLPATYGPLAFNVVARGDQLHFRAQSQLGANLVFQETVLAGFSVTDVVHISIGGVDSAELLLED